MNYALIIAGGSGNRMGQDIPKQFMHVDNCPIIIHTMLAFQKHPDIDGIAVVCLDGWQTVLQSYANQFMVTKLRWIFPGGGNGQESIHNGIYGLKDAGIADDDLVLVHDAVRPLLSQDIISSNIAICQKYGYAITGIKCRDDKAPFIYNLVTTANGTTTHRSHFFDVSFSGTGDLFASVICGSRLNGFSTEEAAERAGKFLYDSIADTMNDDTAPNDGVNFEKFLRELM